MELVKLALEQRTLRDLHAMCPHATAVSKPATVRQILASLEGQQPSILCSAGVPLDAETVSQLLSILDSLPWDSYRKRSGYGRAVASLGGSNFVLGTTLGVKGASGFPEGVNTQRVKRAQLKHEADLLRLWDICAAAIARLDPDYRFSSVQVNMNFSGRAHVDKRDTNHQYALSLGPFTGGQLVVSTDDPLQLRVCDTHNRLLKCDGRHSHWVTRYSGRRYSLIFYSVVETERQPRLSNLMPGSPCGQTPAELMPACVKQDGSPVAKQPLL